MRLSPVLAALAALFFLVCDARAAEAGSAGPPYGRVVSLYAAHAENLAFMGALGVLVGASEPMEGLPVVSARDGAEAIAALGPDLVLARPMHRSTQPGLIEQLERLGIAVACLQPVSMAELAPYWIELGRLTGREDAAREMAARFESDLAALKAKAAAIPEGRRKKVFFEAIHRQMKTVSPESMAAFVLDAAGVVNLARDARPVSGTNIADFGLERVVALGDTLDVYLAQTGPMNPVTAAEIAATPGLSSLAAVREGRVRLVDEAIASRPTPRLLEGVRAVAAACYPEDQSAGDIP